MDPSEREKHRTQFEFMQDPGLARGALWLIVGLPAIGLFALTAVWTEARAVAEFWPWRNAVECTAVVNRHEVTPLGEANQGPYEHVIEYTYDATETSFTQSLNLRSWTESAADFQERQLKLSAGSSFQVYYLPDRPQSHQILADPRVVVQGGLWRLSVVAAIAFSLALVVVFAWLATRRRRPRADVKLFLPPELPSK